MRTRNINLRLIRYNNPEYPETWNEFQLRKIRNIWLQIKKQYWNLINKS